jgi:hypothetical protein
MDRVRSGRAHCALCGDTIDPREGALVTPDFLADDGDPLWRFSDAAMHRPCFLVWERRKQFVDRYNRLAARWVAPDGTRPWMTAEGEVVSISSAGKERWSDATGAQ